MTTFIIHNDNSTSKLTIAVDRVTIKIAAKDKELTDRIEAMSKLIVEKVCPVENTLRGQFEIVEGYLKITMTKFKVNKENVATFHEGDMN